MRLNYTVLLEKISKEQGLGIAWKEIPLIVNTGLTTYTMAYINYEDEEYIVIVIPDAEGAEFVKILNKNTVLSVEIVYQQMMETPKDSKGDVSYV